MGHLLLNSSWPFNYTEKIQHIPVNEIEENKIIYQHIHPMELLSVESPEIRSYKHVLTTVDENLTIK